MHARNTLMLHQGRQQHRLSPLGGGSGEVWSEKAGSSMDQNAVPLFIAQNGLCQKKSRYQVSFFKLTLKPIACLVTPSPTQHAAHDLCHNVMLWIGLCHKSGKDQTTEDPHFDHQQSP